MEKILNILLAFSLLITFYSCDVNGPGTQKYNGKAGSELMSHGSTDNYIDKLGVFVFQLESSNEDSVDKYDSDIKGTDIAEIEFLERFNYTFKLSNIDSLSAILISPNGEQIFNLTEPNQTSTFSANAGVYKLKLINHKTEKGIRKIFYKPDYDTISTFKIFNSNNDIIYSIITENECKDCNLKNIDIQNYKLDSVNFTNADFQNANIRGANLKYSVLNYVNFLSTKADSTDLSYAVFDKPKDLRHATFNYVTAKGLQINDAFLNFAVFYDCDISGSKITNSTLDKTDMFACDLSNSILTDNNFQSAKFEYCRFDSSDITGSDFCNSDLKDATFVNSIGDNTTLCVPDSAKGNGF